MGFDSENILIVIYYWKKIVNNSIIILIPISLGSKSRSTKNNFRKNLFLFSFQKSREFKQSHVL